MNAGDRQVIAEKVSSTVRVLELLGFEYEVRNHKRKRKKEAVSPRVVEVKLARNRIIRVYSGTNGYTWANDQEGGPLPVNSPEALYGFLKRRRRPAKTSSTPAKRASAKRKRRA